MGIYRFLLNYGVNWQYLSVVVLLLNDASRQKLYGRINNILKRSNKETICQNMYLLTWTNGLLWIRRSGGSFSY